MGKLFTTCETFTKAQCSGKKRLWWEGEIIKLLTHPQGSACLWERQRLECTLMNEKHLWSESSRLWRTFSMLMNNIFHKTFPIVLHSIRTENRNEMIINLIGLWCDYDKNSNKVLDVLYILNDSSNLCINKLLQNFKAYFPQLLSGIKVKCHRIITYLTLLLDQTLFLQLFLIVNANHYPTQKTKKKTFTHTQREGQRRRERERINPPECIHASLLTMASCGHHRDQFYWESYGHPSMERLEKDSTYKIYGL